MPEENKPDWFRKIAGRRRNVVRYVKSPLGFYTLALLIVESFLIGVGTLFGLSEPLRIDALIVGVVLFIVVVGVVTLLVIKYPQALVFGEQSHLEWESMHIFGDNVNPWEGRYIEPKAGTEPPPSSKEQIVAQPRKNSTPSEGAQ